MNARCPGIFTTVDQRFLFRLFLVLQTFILIIYFGGKPVFSQEKNQERILVVAPHPDDEVLAMGGWLCDRTASGSEVWAVFMTDGEAYPKAARKRFKKPQFLLRAHDYRTLGKMRRIEAMESLKILKIPVERSFFLGYPNGLLNRLKRQRDSRQLVRSSTTRQRYGKSLIQGASRAIHGYCGSSLFRDVSRILELSKPDIILIPHPQDTNSDHRATFGIVSQILNNRGEHIKLYGYLVHLISSKFYPKPYGYRPDAGIVSPTGFPSPLEYFPSVQSIICKEKAIRCHKTQIKLGDGFLVSFIRKNEIYWNVSAEKYSPGKKR